MPAPTKEQTAVNVESCYGSSWDSSNIYISDDTRNGFN